jgi:hypothetical protein
MVLTIVCLFIYLFVVLGIEPAATPPVSFPEFYWWGCCWPPQPQVRGSVVMHPFFSLMHFLLISLSLPQGPHHLTFGCHSKSPGAPSAATLPMQHYTMVLSSRVKFDIKISNCHQNDQCVLTNGSSPCQIVSPSTSFLLCFLELVDLSLNLFP